MDKHKFDDMSLKTLERHVLLAVQSLQLELEKIKQASLTEPIAVIGIGCRFPGGSNSPEAFWQMLAEGRDAIEEMPRERYDIDEFYHPDVSTPGKSVCRWGSFLEHIDQFDAAFFGISPREAMYMDPQHRILLEVTWEALERAGLQPEKLSGSSTGVFMGLFNKDYSDCLLDQSVADRGASANRYTATGIGPHFASGRISYHLGLQGPSMVVDTACSSSLVAVHLACQSLRNDECQMALAGAVDLRFHPWENLGTSKALVLSPRGRCRTYDASADGFVRGEGCGVVVLKRHSQALADGDTILALIRGSAVNNDGRSKGLTAPNGKAQEAVLRQALQNSGVLPEQISYIEAHGTGTRLGDPIEFEALKNVIGQAHPEGSVCLVGSVKTNIGHLEAAAGMAGLVKTILCMQKQVIPPHLHLKTLNPRINLEHTPFIIPRQVYHWSSIGPRYAGVSASGLSGTNAHIVLEEVTHSTRIENQPFPSVQRTNETWLLPLSAKNDDGLQQLAEVWHSELQSPNSLSNASLRHICSTASLRRSHYQQRLALVCASHGELTTQLSAFLQEKVAPGMSKGLASGVNTRPVFVFSGQGAQYWAGMGQELFKQEAVFRTALEQCDALLRKHVTWSLLAELQADETHTRLQETAIAQPTLFSLQVALSNLWRSWGVEPAAVVGHSVGEIASAYVAGALDLEDAICIVVQRSSLMQQTRGLGYMAAAEISETQAREFLIDYTGRVAIAVVNSPTSIVLSGETEAMHEIVQKMSNDNILIRKLNVENAFHSPQMEPLRNPVVESLQGIKPRPGSLLSLSTVTGEPCSGEEYDAAYWGRNMCETVCFSPAIGKLLDMGHDTFLEVSPHPVLERSVKQILAHHERSGCVVSSMRRGVSERKSMLTALGTLYTRGISITWEQIYQASGEPSKVVQLPTYPWQRKRHWFSDNFKPFSQQAIAPNGRLTGHPLLLRRLRSATHDDVFETTISTKAYPWLIDHQVFGMPVFPGAAYIEMMHKSVTTASNYDVVHLTDLYFRQALRLSPGQECVVQLLLQSSSDSDNPAGEIQVLSCSENEDFDEWTLHATGRYQLDRQVVPTAGVSERTDLDIVRERCTEITQGEEHYHRMNTSGLAFGPTFQGVQQIWSRQGEALGQLCLPQQLASEQSSYFMHPAFLDACIQTAAFLIVAAAVSDGQGDLYLPLSIDGVFFHQRPGNEIWVHTTVSMTDLKQGLVIAEVHILNERGELIVRMDGLHLRRAPISTLAGRATLSPPHWLYKLQWDQKAHQGILHDGGHISSSNPRSWLLFCDKSGTGTQLAAHLRERGEECFLVFADQHYRKTHESEQYTVDPSSPEHFQTLLQECTPLLKYPRYSIVYLWAVDAIVTPDGTSEQLMQEQQRLCGGLLHLVQAVVQRQWTTSPHLWVITQNSQDVIIGPSASVAKALAFVQAPLWGLGRVIAYEHPDLHCRLVDFTDHNSWDIERLIEELLNSDPEDQIALRVEGRYTARLAVAESDVEFLRKQKQHKHTIQEHRTLQFSASGTYLITGGLGGLGIAIVEWMVEERGVRHLVLTGRSAPTPEVLSGIRRLEQRGAQIVVLQADVADQNQVVQLLETIREAGIPLRGIIHSAGVLDDGVLVQLNWTRFAKVLAPKVQGAWNLHLLTRDIQLDFFVLFSSVASLVPAPGQANYAAANAFIDGLAHYRRSLGLPAVSINWGAWADVGMTKDSVTFLRRVEREGVQLISLDQGMVALEQVLLDDPVQIAVFPMDWSVSTDLRTGRKTTIVQNMVGDHLRQSKQTTLSRAAHEVKSSDQQSYAVRVQERPQLLLEDLSQQAVKVLGLDPTSQFECGWNLFEIGLDSFMALELRNAIHKLTGLSVPASLVFGHPTVDAIAAYLAAQLAPAQGAIS